MTAKVIGVDIDGHMEWHAPSVLSGGYATLCGLDGHDERTGQRGVSPAPRGQKITCPQCKLLWQGVMLLKLDPDDFA